MRQITPEPYPDVTMKEVTHDDEDTVTDRLDQVTEARKPSMLAPPYSALAMIGSHGGN